MNLEKMIQNYKTETKVIPREEKILETIQKSKEVMMEVQSEHTMSYGEFLFSQFRLIRKRWWMLQAMLLVLVFRIFDENTGNFLCPFYRYDHSGILEKQRK